MRCRASVPSRVDEGGPKAGDPGGAHLCLLVGVLVVAPLLSCQDFRIGDAADDSVEGKGYALRIVATESCPLPPEVDPEEMTIVSYKVHLTSADARGVPANYFYASLLCTDGTRYLAGFEGCAPLLAHDPLGRGQEAEGYLNFPIPRSKTPETLVYAPELMGDSNDSTIRELPVASSGGDSATLPGATAQEDL